MGAHPGMSRIRAVISKLKQRERSTIIALTDMRDIKISIFAKVGKKESQLLRENKIVPSTGCGNCRSKRREQNSIIRDELNFGN